LAIGVIAAMVGIDCDRSDAFAVKPHSYNIKSIANPCRREA